MGEPVVFGFLTLAALGLLLLIAGAITRRRGLWASGGALWPACGCLRPWVWRSGCRCGPGAEARGSDVRILIADEPSDAAAIPRRRLVVASLSLYDVREQ